MKKSLVISKIIGAKALLGDSSSKSAESFMSISASKNFPVSSRISNGTYCR